MVFQSGTVVNFALSFCKLAGINWHYFCTFGLICPHAMQCFVMTTGPIFIKEQALLPEADFCRWPSFSSQSYSCQTIIQLHIFEQARTQWDRGRTVLCTLVIWAGCHFSAIKAPDFKSFVWPVNQIPITLLICSPWLSAPKSVWHVSRTSWEALMPLSINYCVLREYNTLCCRHPAILYYSINIKTCIHTFWRIFWKMYWYGAASFI